MIYRILIILFVILGTAYDLVLKVVQYRSAGNPTPANVADVYDAETYQKWKRYCGEKCRISIIRTCCVFVCDLALLCTNAYAAVAAWFSDAMIAQLSAVVLLAVLELLVFDMIFSYINTMVIEQKYGFNRTSMKTFLLDILRQLLLNLLICMGLSYGIGSLYEAMSGYMILLFAAVVLCFMLLTTFLYPFFSRIGNKFTPLEEGELKDWLVELLTRHGYQVRAIEIMDASRRTTKLNAYFTGIGKTKTIVLFDNLVNTMTPDEICAVFAHELGHGIHKDTLKQGILNFGNLLIMSLLAWLCVRDPAMHEAFGFAGVNYGFAYILTGIGLGLLQPLTSLATNAHSRYCEYRADRQAVQEGYGQALISGLKTLAQENFAHLAPSKLNVVLEYSHPPMSQRIEAIEKEIKNSKI